MNKPVAWTTNGREVMRLDNDDDTLHTHPVKELTDEEIEKVWYEECSSSDSLIEFARAILRKAQEK